MAETAETATQEIDAQIAALGDWRGKTLATMRDLIRAADPRLIETVKWRKPTNPGGVPVWEHQGIVCTGGVFKSHVKITFAKGAQLEDTAGVFNNGLDGNSMRAIDLREGDTVDGPALQALVRAACDLNAGLKAKRGT
jgi:hypothetical protein